MIGAGARIEDAYIGPYTSIGDGVRDRAAPKSSTRSSSPARWSRTSARGWRRACSAANVKLTRSDGMPKTLRMLVGDNSEIKII